MGNVISEIVDRIGNTPDKLLEVLIQTQQKSKQNYVTESELRTISKLLDVPFSKVYGVATFYSMLSVKKRGNYVIQICNSGPCYINGAGDLVSFIEELLDIKMGEITNDGVFSLEYTSCIGACDKGPAIKINDKVYGNLNKTKIVEIIDKLRKEVLMNDEFSI
ncbi:complex I 24 kDa subunit family protein [Caldisalinibacter kiritimatiensis]|uniref:NADH:ubiquinone oxidoreductase 24 kD subunit n=1 Tax=Caldisalinibacter kiritimatiensis TaxID=1304284 RepID=R1CTN6_9FIRM|nr:NAD(P)H-dependent oxidoreductase subunit E [Caldisalinibacter kiritimatiensis]EOD00049.1 NADH:ubiquinone oxidoreductase 24 kD subunit [Caldisalinibacter kiritimatiensis]